MRGGLLNAPLRLVKRSGYKVKVMRRSLLASAAAACGEAFEAGLRHPSGTPRRVAVAAVPAYVGAYSAPAARPPQGAAFGAFPVCL